MRDGCSVCGGKESSLLDDAFGAEGAVVAAVDARLSEELDPTLRAQRDRHCTWNGPSRNAQGNPFTQAQNYLAAEAEAEGYRTVLVVCHVSWLTQNRTYR